MSLEQQIMTEMKEAMKARNEGVLRALRAIKAEIIKAKTEPGAAGEIDEATEQKFLQKMMKQRRDSLERQSTFLRDRRLLRRRQASGDPQCAFEPCSSCSYWHSPRCSPW